MTPLVELWLPILVSSVVVFFLAMAFWTASPHHKPDMGSLGRATEDKVMALAKSEGIKPGQYVFPNCGNDKAYAKSDEFKAKWEGGCMGKLQVFQPITNMGKHMMKNMGKSFVVYLLVSAFVAYLTGLSRAPGADGMAVLQVAGTAALGFYIFGDLAEGIWFGRTTRNFITNAFDAVVYAAATGLIFMFLWPGVEAAAGGAIPTP